MFLEVPYVSVNVCCDNGVLVVLLCLRTKAISETVRIFLLKMLGSVPTDAAGKCTDILLKIYDGFALPVVESSAVRHLAVLFSS